MPSFTIRVQGRLIMRKEYAPGVSGGHRRTSTRHPAVAVFNAYSLSLFLALFFLFLSFYFNLNRSLSLSFSFFLPLSLSLYVCVLKAFIWC